jgi:hypothetical protein
MTFNLFDWIREGVKRSVMLGVSDAMEAIGAPDRDEGHAQFARLLAASATSQPALQSSAADSALKRKRLGRSLRDDATS